MLLYFSPDWCIPCIELDGTTFTDERVIRATDDFVRLKADLIRYDSPEAKALRQRFDVAGVPTLVLLDRTREEVPIIVRMDAGFCDKTSYQACEELGIGYVNSGRLLEEIKDGAEKVPETSWTIYRDGSGGPAGPQEWAYHQRGDRRGTWSRFRRMIPKRQLPSPSLRERAAHIRLCSQEYPHLYEPRAGRADRSPTEKVGKGRATESWSPLSRSEMLALSGPTIAAKTRLGGHFSPEFSLISPGNSMEVSNRPRNPSTQKNRTI